MANAMAGADARQAESVSQPHTLDFSRLCGLVERMAVALERLADCGVPMGAAGMPSDAEVLHYMRGLGLPLPPIRVIADAVGCSHAYIYKALPLSRAYFRQHNGKFRKGRRLTAEAEDEGRFDE